MDLAHHAASMSRDPSTKVGAVIVNDRHHIAIGFNDFPKGVKHDADRYTNKEKKYQLVVHAEANAIIKAGDLAIGSTLYITHFPCCDCAGLIVNSGIKNVVYNKILTNWNHTPTILMFSEGGVSHEQFTN